MKEYGITEQEYNDIFKRQGCVCGICGSSTPGWKRKNFSVDHCHDTGVVRGILCQRCNAAIGFLLNSADNCFAAAKYLKRFGKRVLGLAL